MKRIHITSGEYHDQYFQKQYHEPSAPFNEAMMSGKAGADIFSADFIAERARELRTTSQEYADQMQGFLTFAKNLHDYQEVVLWFGPDTFCQMNLLTILAFLEGQRYAGQLYSVIIDDEDYTILRERAPITLGGYEDLYSHVLNRNLPVPCRDATMQRAIDLYFDYRSENGRLAAIVKSNPKLCEHELAVKLLSESGEYGLSDLQAVALIRRYRK